MGAAIDGGHGGRQDNLKSHSTRHTDCFYTWILWFTYIFFYLFVPILDVPDKRGGSVVCRIHCRCNEKVFAASFSRFLSHASQMLIVLCLTIDIEKKVGWMFHLQSSYPA